MKTRGIESALKGQVRPRGGRQRDRIDVRRKEEPMQEPTPEQAARYEFARSEIRDEGRRLGFAYRRRPLIESLAEKIGLSTTDLAALRYYRAAFERADASPTKSCLDVGAGGGGGNGTEGRALTAIEQALSAKAILDRCDRAIGAVADTVREVAVFDRSFSDIAVQRYGGREQSWIADEGGRKTSRSKIVPRSGRHREAVAAEFHHGTKALVRLLAGYRPVIGSGNVVDPAAVSVARITVSAALVDAAQRSGAGRHRAGEGQRVCRRSGSGDVLRHPDRDSRRLDVGLDASG